MALYVGDSYVVHVVNVIDPYTDQPVTNASITAEMRRESDQLLVASDTLTHKSQGQYIGVLTPATDITAGTQYRINVSGSYSVTGPRTVKIKFTKLETAANRELG
ncbi:MAG: hypothetical protein ONB06_04030 [candidate division KSB1 bacterium]|nr:hypothetical protein [candidate division KSB1 bacterium]